MRLILSTLVGVAFLVMGVPAFAQQAVTVTIGNPASLSRTDASGNAVTKRAAFNPEGINYDDCESDLRLVVPVTIQNAPAGAHLEVWSGSQASDCGPAATRATTCRQVQTGLPAVTASLGVPVRSIVAGANLEAAADGSICGTVDRSTVSVQILVLDAAGNDLGDARLSEDVDTVGNPAPQVVVDQVQGTVHATATPPDDATTTQFAFYCAAADANDAGTCSGSAISYVGAEPDADFDARYRCVTLVLGAGVMPPYNVYVKTLPDGSQFSLGTNVAVRVSSVDDFGNLGPLSAPQCAVVEEVADVDDPTSGKCAVSRGPGSSPAGGVIPFALVLAGVVARIARARARAA